MTERTGIIGVLMKSCKYSRDDIESLKSLSETHQLLGSLAALNSHADFVPPESLKVLSGRIIKKIITEHHQEHDSTIRKLELAVALHSFLQHSIYTI